MPRVARSRAIALPLQRQSEQMRTDMSVDHIPIPQPHTKALRIFLVEDIPTVRDLIVASLADVDGITWSGFSDSENDAIEQLKQGDNDILIIDIELKQGNGMNLLRRLTQSKVSAGSIKIIFSNNVCDAYRRAGEKYGVHYFFDKSFELSELHALLKSLSPRPATGQ
jgi:DNA-binding NarL/FixJ family response regulator